MSGNIILIDDHTLFRYDIRSVLDGVDYEVIGEVADGLNGVKLVEQLRPDLAPLDLNMPVMNGREALGQMLSSNPEQRVMVLTVLEDGDELIGCMKQEAHDFLLKNTNTGFFTEVVGKALNSDNVFSPEVAAHLAKLLVGPIQPQSDAYVETLTPRECETPHHLAIGHSNKAIAKKLNLAESTVEAYMQNILCKLGLSSRVQVAVHAIQHSIHSPERDGE